MPKIDEVKAEITFLTDLFKISIALVVAIVAGLSKLYLDKNTDVLFYIGVVLVLLVLIVPVVVFKKIKKHIKELGEINA